MTSTLNTGPMYSVGDLLSFTGGGLEYNPDAGPGITFQGDAIPDVRYFVPKDYRQFPGVIRAHLDSPYILTTDAVPAASAATAVNIAAAANAVSGTPMTLAAATAGIATAIPFYPYQSGTLATSGITLDYGFGTLNCTANTAAVTPSTGTLQFYSVGQWVVVANVGNSGATIALISQITAVGTSTITLSPAPLATNSAAPVGWGNIWTTLFGQGPALAWGGPYVSAGPALMYDPLSAISRGWGISSTDGAAVGGTFTMKGFDIYGQAMTETVTHAGGATTIYCKKAVKHITSVTPNFSDAHNYSAGTSDLFGIALRNDRWEYDNFYWAGAFLTASTGWTAADATSPATATTGDVRGTIQIGTRGPLGSGASGGAANGTLRIALFSTMPLYNLINANARSSVTMYGVTQF